MEASACSPSVVLPLLSGPYTSTMRPRGMPPPRHRSSVNDPDGKVSLRVPPRPGTGPASTTRTGRSSCGCPPAQAQVQRQRPGREGLPAGAPPPRHRSSVNDPDGKVSLRVPPAPLLTPRSTATLTPPPSLLSPSRARGSTRGHADIKRVRKIKSATRLALFSAR
jgi:hypothetical protein